MRHPRHPSARGEWGYRAGVITGATSPSATGRPMSPEPARVGGERRPQARVALVPHAVPRADVAHDRRQLRIVNVADPGEEMVLDLVVEPAEVPAQDTVPGREVGLFGVKWVT
jgi:hypothetical protein